MDEIGGGVAGDGAEVSGEGAGAFFAVPVVGIADFENAAAVGLDVVVVGVGPEGAGVYECGGGVRAGGGEEEKGGGEEGFEGHFFLSVAVMGFLWGFIHVAAGKWNGNWREVFGSASACKWEVIL